MRYLMFVCKDTVPVEKPTSEPMEIDDWVAGLDASGTRILGDPIAEESEARTVRVRGGEVLVTDGPFLETKEVLAGIDVLDCADLDEALRAAATHPMAAYGVIELRPFLEM